FSSFLTNQHWRLMEVGPIDSEFTGRTFPHTVSNASQTLYTSRIYGDSLTDNPDVLIFATLRWVSTAILNQSTVGMTYDGSGVHRVMNASTSVENLRVGARFDMVIPPAEYETFEVISGTTGFRVELDEPSVNGNVDDLLFVMPKSPEGRPNYGDFSTFDLEYSESTNRYAIYNYRTNGVDSRWHVMVVPQGARAFRHVAQGPNIFAGGGLTRLDHPLLNGNPDAILTVTKVYNFPGEAGLGTENDHEIGVRYTDGHHHLYNADQSSIILDSRYNVLIGTGKPD
ncbi:MAG: hypothetical protein AAGG01_10395, partial [Planctomycetota bacterium]